MGGGIEYAPQEIRGLFDKIHDLEPRAVLSGILGDSHHVYGYHRCRAVLPSSDYSVGESVLDRQGDPWAASALDINLPPDLMKTVSARLMKAAQAKDPRLAAVREWFGTTNGTTVTGWDLLKHGYTSSDDSHLWHVHLSFHRKYATDAAALAPIAAVFTGADGDDELTPEDKKWIESKFADVPKGVWQYQYTNHDTTTTMQAYVANAWRFAKDSNTATAQILTRVAQLQASVANLVPVQVAAGIADSVVAKIKALKWTMQ